MNLIVVYISASVISGISSLSLLVYLLLKNRNKVVLKLAFFLLAYFISIISWGFIYAVTRLEIEFNADLSYMISFATIYLLGIALLDYSGSLFQIPFRKKVLIIFTILAVLSYSTVIIFDYFFLFYEFLISCILFSVITSIIYFKRQETFLPKRIGVLTIAYISLLVPVTIYDLFLIQEDQLMLSFFLFFFYCLTVIIYILTSLKNEQSQQYSETSFNGYKLTCREIEVVQHLLAGMTYKEIAAQLFISVATVKTHLNKIYKKTNCKSRHEITIRFK